MPRTLAIDCATDACSVALFEGGELIAADYRLLGRGHAEALVPMIAGLPGKGEASRIAVSTGPGSFTGVRVGIAAARALQIAWGSELRGFPTLALAAAMARAQAGARPLAIAMSGGHGEWFVQRFAADMTVVTAALSLRPDDAVVACGEELVAGSQAPALVAARGYGTALALLPDVRHLMALGEELFSDGVQPLYGRGPDARPPAARPADSQSADVAK